MNPLSLIGGLTGGASGGAGGGFPFTSSASADSRNQISSGSKSIGGINYASQNSNLLMIGLVGVVVVAGIYLIKKA